MRIFKTIAVSLFIITIIVAAQQRTLAQARPSPAQQVISLDFIGAFEGDGLMAQYEWKDSPVTSWAVRAFFWPSDANYWSAFGVGAAYRFYVADSRALTGLSVAPAASIHFFSQNANGGRSGMSFWIGGDAGYKWIFDDFSVEPLVQLAIGFGPSGNGSTAVPAKSTGPEAVVRVFGGYAW